MQLNFLRVPPNFFSLLLIIIIIHSSRQMQWHVSQCAIHFYETTWRQLNCGSSEYESSSKLNKRNMKMRRKKKSQCQNICQTSLSLVMLFGQKCSRFFVYRTVYFCHQTFAAFEANESIMNPLKAPAPRDKYIINYCLSFHSRELISARQFMMFRDLVGRARALAPEFSVRSMDFHCG